MYFFARADLAGDETCGLDDECGERDVRIFMGDEAVPSSTSAPSATALFSERVLEEVQEVRGCLKCCVRCAMRFAGVHDQATYRLPDEELEAAVSTEPTDAPKVCPLCLGLLKQCVSPAAAAAIAADAKASGHEMREFGVTMTLPVQLLFRERGGWLHLQDTRKAAVTAAGGGYSSIAPSRGSSQVGGSGWEKITELKDVFRWLIAPRLSDALGRKCVATSNLTVHLNYTHSASSTEHHAMMDQLVMTKESGYAKRKRAESGQPGELDSIRNVTKALQTERAKLLIGAESSGLCPPKPAELPAECAVAMERAPVTLTGRYCKETRALPQSAWIIDGARKAEGSVAECITDVVVPLFGASEGRFHSAGREDVDVRMLGEGRPFLIEMIDPKTPYHTPEAIEQMQTEINAKDGLVGIHGLRECDHAIMADIMKQGEEAHRKDYRCVVHLSRKVTQDDIALLNGSVDLVCQQLTPLRVLHRRTLMVRERTIHAMTAVQLSSRFIQLDLTTQAGTYVKEFVHGDFGRSVPNVGSLLNCEADILQLDVVGLHEPPPKSNTSSRERTLELLKAAKAATAQPRL